MAQLRFTDLTDEEQEAYGYSPEAAADYVAQRKAYQAQAADEARVAAAIKAQHQAEDLRINQEYVAEQIRMDSELQSKHQAMQQQWDLEDINQGLRDVNNSLERLDWTLRSGR